MTFVWLVAGLVLLVVGADALAKGASRLAAAAGISPLVIGLTIVAFGTSAPEMAVSVGAAWSGQADLALGNVVGSNLFNILSVLSLSSVASPAGIAVPEAAMMFDIPVMIGVALACLPIFFAGYVITRWNGALFLLYYLAYTAYLILATFGSAMLWFVIPLTAVMLAVLAFRFHRSKWPN